MTADAFLDILAKSPAPDVPGDRGETLDTHSLAALAAAGQVAERVGLLPGVPEWFWRAAATAALLHDFGKIDPGFQQQVRHPGQRRYAWRQRHEVLSLGALGLVEPEPSEYRLWVAAGIATHHRPLRHRRDPRREVLYPHRAAEAQPLDSRFTVTNTPEALSGLLSWFADQAHQRGLLTKPPKLDAVGPEDVRAAVDVVLGELDVRFGEDSAALPDGLPLVLLQGAVTLADHLASAHTTLLTGHPLDGFPNTFEQDCARKGHTPHDHQLQAARAEKRHLLLRAPTGNGKTEGGLLWSYEAIHQIIRERGGHPRLLYVLPYLASINAMADRLRGKCAGEVGVLHSRAGVYHLERLDNDVDNAPARALETVEASRLHRELLRVTTPYQLLQAAFAGAADSGRLLDAANSVFVFDELHAYEPQRLGMILAMMRLWSHDLGSRIAVLSATLPDRFAHLLAETLGEDNLEPLNGFDTSTAPPRHQLALSEDHLTAPETIDAIATDLEAGQAVLVIANNVADAVTLYEQLQEHAPVRDDGTPAAWLLHGRFENRDRVRIETEVTDWFAAENPTPRPGLLVATQTAEVSLNVDLTVLHTSCAVLEALLQRFGRINRRGLRPPERVHVYAPDYRTGRGGAERADGVYDAQPTRHTWALLRDHDPARPLDETDTQDWLNKLYATEWGDYWEKKVRDHRDAFTAAYLDFTEPFTDRAHLKDDFFAQFDGFEAILDDRIEDYRAALNQGRKAEGRLLASRYHIPLPDHCRWGAEFNDDLKIHIIRGDYSPETGLTQILDDTTYQPGVIV